jgi:hypothetical protein
VRAAAGHGVGSAHGERDFEAMEWRGFCSTATRSAAYYLDDFVFGGKKEGMIGYSDRCPMDGIKPICVF